MAPLEKADHHFKAGYTFPQEGENQEAWTVPNPEGIFSLENMSWPTERCLPLARGALTEPQAPAHSLLILLPRAHIFMVSPFANCLLLGLTSARPGR